ncbi:serine carboxypeptidase-like 13 isoform X2 [Apium graveolens]|uniref:serine carboxypeptidase-like 13 isoform X2 n=1 Tax=Apium graveolens TaxID=4045 RepID=UPI003D790180
MQSMQLQTNMSKFIPRVLVFIVVLLNVSDHSFSQTIVKALPGFPGELPFKLETGYVEVGDKEDVALFYYFVESQRNPTDDPFLIWISGGPGCSTLRSLFYQTGPFTIEYPDTSKEIPDLHLNPYTWTKLASILYVDSPTSGFSYTKSPKTYRNSDTLSAKYFYQFLSKGYILGNPLTDRNVDFNIRIPYAHQMALLSDDLYESTKGNCNGEYINVHPSNKLCQSDLQKVDECLENVYLYHILEPICTSDTSTRSLLQQKINSSTNPLHLLRAAKLKGQQWCRDNTHLYMNVWANNQSVRKALNIREDTIGEWAMCNADDHYAIGKNDSTTYAYDVPSTVDVHRNFTQKSCRALINSGDHDMVFPHLGTRKWIRDLHLNVDSAWAPWFVKQQVAGYTESYSQDNFTLTYATVKGAGHVAIEFKPEESLVMVSRWLDHNHL